jgi:cell division protease FtsH
MNTLLWEIPILFLFFSFSLFCFFQLSDIWLEFKDFYFEPGESFGPFSNFSTFNNLNTSLIEIETNVSTTFQDVAGNQEAKEELQEVVRFLENPEIFAKLGASIPKGVLLEGPPGTGKTLFAKAIAGESGTSFLKVSGSQFVELLAGVGASRVRDLFEKARSLKPCIIFIDELDSIARARSSNSMGGSNDEREQALNQILTEMDGFTIDTGIVVIAATNRIDILDSAIKRPGRFDRQIIIPNPNVADREAILKIHARTKKFEPSVSFALIAQRSIGFSGADLANLLNEAAILATRKQKTKISMDEINIAIDKIILGLEKTQKRRLKSRQSNATYEVGKSFVNLFASDSEMIERISIIPRNNSESSLLLVPTQKQYVTRASFLQKLVLALSGRASEELVQGISECTTRSDSNIFELTRYFRAMVINYAMTRLQQMKQEIQRRNLYLIGSDVKEELSNLIDNYMTNFVRILYQQILTILGILRPGNERIVDELLIYEEISGFSLKTILVEYLALLEILDLLEANRNTVLYTLVKEEIQSEREIPEEKKEEIPEEENLITGFDLSFDLSS